MPIRLSAAGFPAPPSLPNVTVPTLVWHAIDGAVLGAVFPAVESASPDPFFSSTSTE